MYHFVRDLVNSRFPRIKALDLKLFREQISFLNENFRIIKARELIDAFSPTDCERVSSASQSAHKPAVLLTFDDGYIDCYTNVFPILDELGVEGSFFVTGIGIKRECLLDVNKIHLVLASADIDSVHGTMLRAIEASRGAGYDLPDTLELLSRYGDQYKFDDQLTAFVKRMLQVELPRQLRHSIVDILFRKFVGGTRVERVLARELYMGEEQLRVMKKHNMHIGLHGYDHEWLGKMDRDKYENDITRALDIMDVCGLLDRSEWTMNYPYGSYSAGVRDFAASNGCAVGFTTEKAVARVNTHDRLLLPRIDTNEFPPKSTRYLDII